MTKWLYSIELYKIITANKPENCSLPDNFQGNRPLFTVIHLMSVRSEMHLYTRLNKAGILFPSLRYNAL